MSLRPWISNLSLSAPVVAGGLSVYGIRGAARSPVDYATLDEALANGLAEVTEISESGSVPELRFVNRSDRKILLLAGEQLVGAKQNRVLNTSILAEAASETKIPVSCVEQGRWHYKTRGFGSSGTSAHAKLRAEMAMDVSNSLKRGGAASANQGKVWSEVSRKLASLHVDSHSIALEKAFEDRMGEINARIVELKPEADWCGVMVFCHDRLSAIDCFDRPESLRKYWTKLIRGHSLDAIEQSGEGALPRESAEAWLERLANSGGAGYQPSGGVGLDHRLEGAGIHGNALLHDGVPLHLQAFAGQN